MVYAGHTQYHRNSSSQSGFTFIELLIVTFVVATVVTGVFGLFVLSLRTSQESERRIVAVALANERAEMVRNLPYVDVGTSGGVPAGTIPQQETITRNSVPYTVKTDIRYVDDDYDGSLGGGSSDGKVTICHEAGSGNQITLHVDQSAVNAHLAHGDSSGACGSSGSGDPPEDLYNADYKQVRIEVSWNSPNAIKPVLLITHVTPPGIEGGELGGTLDFLAMNAAGEGIENAEVEIINNDVSPAIDITTQTNAEGHVILPGLPPSADTYQIIVSDAGYTSEQTYDVSASFIPDSDHSHLSMIQNQVTSKTFTIDRVANLDIQTKDESGTAIGAIAYHIQGTKTTGVDGSSQPVYILDADGSTNVTGQASHENLVWDTYTVTIDSAAVGYDIKETSLVLPAVLNPGDNATLEVTLVPHVPFSLHVTVVSPANQPVDNATVHVVKGASYDQTKGTGPVGQVFFGDMTEGGSYTVTIDAPGYETKEETITVDGTNRITQQLTPQS